MNRRIGFGQKTIRDPKIGPVNFITYCSCPGSSDQLEDDDNDDGQLLGLHSGVVDQFRTDPSLCQAASLSPPPAPCICGLMVVTDASLVGDLCPSVSVCRCQKQNAVWR